MYTYYRHTEDLDADLAYPHYSCPVFSKGRDGKVIFGQDDSSRQGEYADRLRDWDSKKANEADEQCKADGLTRDTARRRQRWLTVYYGRPVRLLGIVAGYQPYDGYPWYFYQFEFCDEQR
jgi:hypothetical protein